MPHMMEKIEQLYKAAEKVLSSTILAFEPETLHNPLTFPFLLLDLKIMYESYVPMSITIKYIQTLNLELKTLG